MSNNIIDIVRSSVLFGLIFKTAARFMILGGLGLLQTSAAAQSVNPDNPFLLQRRQYEENRAKTILEVKGLLHAPLCDGKLFLRQAGEGHKTTMEWTTDFLRNYVPGGEMITNFVKSEFYQDAFLMTSEILPAGSGKGPVRLRPPGASGRRRIRRAHAHGGL